MDLKVMAKELTLRGKKRSELIGYSNPLVVHPGDSIQFMVSTEFTEYEAKLVRLIHGDENPEGPGFKTEAVGEFSETLKGRHQTTYPGSYICMQPRQLSNFANGLSIQAWILATKPAGDDYQTIVAQQANGVGFGLYLNSQGNITLRLSNAEETIDVSTDRSLVKGQWYFVVGIFDQQKETVTVSQRQCGKWPNIAANSEPVSYTHLTLPTKA